MTNNYLKSLQIQLLQAKEIYFNIKVRPNLPKTRIKEIMTDKTIKLDLAAIPEKNKANQEIINYFSKKFEVFKHNVIIISGKKDKIKLIKIIQKKSK